MSTYYKVTAEDGSACHGGTGKWTKNRWRSVKGELVACARGLHLVTRDRLINWLGPVIWEAEIEGEVIDAGNKVVARRARVVRRLDTWNERTARLFAADCAERVLPIFEKQRPGDDRPRKAIEAARAFANIQIDGTARAAASAVASAGPCGASAAAWDAARAAASAAAWDAARAAASAAAWDATRAAAWDIALSAARAAAWAAAGPAARAAARAAAWYAAGDAFDKWATERLWQYLDDAAPKEQPRCPHGNGLSCRECQYEAEAEDATWD